MVDFRKMCEKRYGICKIDIVKADKITINDSQSGLWSIGCLLKMLNSKSEAITWNIFELEKEKQNLNTILQRKSIKYVVMSLFIFCSTFLK